MAMATIAADHERAVEIEERRVHATEHVLFHPIRKSVVSVTSHSLQELDPQYGATIGEATFDLAFLGDRPAGSAAARLLEHVVPVGAHHVAAIFQSRCLVVWDLRDAVLQSVTEVEKQQKSVAALAASLCKDKWLFYASEGSNSIKVAAADAREPPKKISRKAANRSSQLAALAYDTATRVLAAGASDGALQLWRFSEDNTPLSGTTKEEAAQVTPLFAAQTTASPVVRLALAASGQHAQLLLVAYQSRVVEVWDLAPRGPRQREPYRVAVFHCLAPQAPDFAKKNGELSFHLDPVAPVLLIHWHGFHGAGSYAAATEIRLGASATPAPVTLSDWHELVPAAGAPSHDDASAVALFSAGCHAASASSLTAYVSTHHQRQLLPLAVSCQQSDAMRDETNKLSLSTSFQLSVDQYFKYQDVPATLLQVARNPEDASSPQQHGIAFQLQRYSQLTGEVEKLDELPVWNNYQGRQLLPWTLRANEQQTAMCIQLRDPGKSIASEHDAGVAYVLLEVKNKPKSMATDADSEGSGGSVSVTCGSVMDALDVCFCDLRSDEAKQNRAYVMLVLASSGKSIGFQMNCDQVDQNTRVLLQQPIRRLFPTPIALSTHSPHASMVGSRLLYVLADTGGDSTGAQPQTLVLSDDDLAVPRSSASGFQTRANGERIVDVAWNTEAAQSSAESNAGGKPLCAVRTTQRVVVLAASASTSSLSIVAEYDLATDLGSPQSLLWVAQTLLFVTSDQHVRFVTPMVPSTTKPPVSQLLCSLTTDFAGPQRIQLLGACSDRLCYAVQDPRSLECKTYMRPLAVCEPLLLGFSEQQPSDGRLKAIFERDFLVFLATGGLETRNPVSERLIYTLYHDFGWKDTVTKVLDALLNPSTAVAASVSGASGSAGGSAGGASYKKLAHLPPALVSSLLFHAHKWKDGVRVHLANDPALEEYALADDDGLGSGSSAKLPSRTGATASRFQWLAAVLASVGQSELALKCLDLAGDDLAIVDLLHKHGLDPAASEALLAALQKDWTQLNPPLAAITKASSVSAVRTPRQDLFSLLCCDHLTQTERRSRLLTSVRPLDKLTMKSAQKEDAKDKSSAASGRAGVLYWKRLSPEDSRDVLGASSTPHFSADEPKNPASYALFHGGGSSLAVGVSGGSEDASGPGGDAAGASGTAESAAKMTIGPFLEDEDAVVAYWRFEEGSTASDASDASATRTLDSMDTTKRENHLQILQFGRMGFATSSAPVDKGEDGKLQEAFALRFPSAETAAEDDSDEWGAKCSVRTGSTLDIGLVFDEDPYRRKLTFEAWVRNYALFRKKQDAEDQHDGAGDDYSTSTRAWSDDASATRRLVSRRGADKTTWWEFGLRDGGALFLTFAGQTLQADEKIADAAAWQHVAFSIDVTSPKHATLRLFLQAKCVATREIANVDANAKLVAAALRAMPAPADGTTSTLPPPPSTLHLGQALTDVEMTEVRVWATARTAEQLSDMKENYLGIAETKRRMKIAIHQRNCQCEKCLGRRTAKPAGGRGGMPLLGAPLFPSTPPAAAGSARDRRRPQPKA